MDHSIPRQSASCRVDRLSLAIGVTLCAGTLLTTACLGASDPVPTLPKREVDLTPVGGSATTTRPAPVIAEGAIVTMMPGTLIWDAKGGLIFRPDAPTDGAATGSVPAFSQAASLLPCTALARFESMLGVGLNDNSPPPESARSSKDGHPVPEVPAARELGRYYINGQVFAFHGRPHILLSVPPTTTPPASTTATTPESATVASSPASSSPASSSPASSATTAPPAPVLTESADVKSLIQELESRRTTARALETAATLTPSSGNASAAGTTPDATQGGAVPSPAVPATASNRPDGQHINGRQGRVVRHDAWLIFTPDSGTSAPSDAPMVLLPSAQMERLEGLVFRHGDSARYRISGKLVSYRGRQFLLPTLAQVMPPSDLSPGQ
ncbi:MAG: hypothetical protein KGS45_11350 [Planctomycetes bacterium]|nr:hypothetical protein [Planctomycetota bacterium]